VSILEAREARRLCRGSAVVESRVLPGSAELRCGGWSEVARAGGSLVQAWDLLAAFRLSV